ncbi:MAG: type I-E CRISPR-associated protein Cas6/Cse3/CasE [Planctomycetes bacterium]|nr:type I-E CRISPR-associated protein Cas6/Cse3/CasE [Planctomycetota bacterium]
MTYLTQVAIDFASVVRLGIRDVYDWHQRAWQCFPDRDGRPRDFLIRLDRKDAGFQLLIVSPTAPSRPDWCLPESWRGPKQIPPGYFQRSRYRFQLCANPTKKVAVQKPGGGFTKNGRREPLTGREELVAWIRRKGEQSGFVVEESSLRTIPRGREYFEKKGSRGLHSSVEYQGLLVVTDPTKFHDAFTRGIGSAKAFGFGLLVLAPVSAPV